MARKGTKLSQLKRNFRERINNNFQRILTKISHYNPLNNLFSSFQLNKIVKEKEEQFNEEKNNLWRDLTEGFQKVHCIASLACQCIQSMLIILV